MHRIMEEIKSRLIEVLNLCHILLEYCQLHKDNENIEEIIPLISIIYDFIELLIIDIGNEN